MLKVHVAAEAACQSMMHLCVHSLLSTSGTLRGNYGDQSRVKTTPSFICGAGWIDWDTLGCLGVTGF